MKDFNQEGFDMALSNLKTEVCNFVEPVISVIIAGLVKVIELFTKLIKKHYFKEN